ncbi:MAG: peptidase M4 family protein [Rhodococcus sp.]|uniref:M4 family metallopeptidase n=1 Tax=Rhodococcus sp. TaxID=1831 RepID=UPI00169ADB89|nr:M4 family metallopeptidase [Rhodococcus sp. (in: high G+C Gram-positive bacteria)]NLV79497.1 peptidase M4 family protein [Rhodococcus sp. (in: high G+C Gram-positive bacteria)]
MNAIDRCTSCIMPPYLLEHLMDSADTTTRSAIMDTLLVTEQLRGARNAHPTVGVFAAPAQGSRSVFDAHNREDLWAATLVRTEDSSASTDTSVDNAFDGLGTTRSFFRNVLGRDSIDGHGMRLDAFVHFGRRYANAFWDGRQMVFGDGDGRIFDDLTGSLDIIGHELSHGVTEHTAGLVYHNQPGALNESMSDVFGSVVKQWSRNETAEVADWLIGSDVFTPAFAGDALRSLKAPGSAYDTPLFGKDPQPDHMSRFVVLPDTRAGDWGGVHINSGIPNRAFHLTAVGIGGNAWEAPVHIWYESLRASNSHTDFREFAETTGAIAARLFGTGSKEQQVVMESWDAVGVSLGGRSAPPDHESVDTLDALHAQLERLSVDIRDLTTVVRALDPAHT